MTQLDGVTLAILASFILTDLLVLTIATFLAAKGLLLRRTSILGRALALNNFAMAAAYFDVVFSLWLPVLRHPFILIAIRLVVLATTVHAIRAFVVYYGGWRAVLVELRDSLGEIRREVVDFISGRRQRLVIVDRARYRHRLNLSIH